jgi:hypothetical protein
MRLRKRPFSFLTLFLIISSLITPTVIATVIEPATDPGWSDEDIVQYAHTIAASIGESMGSETVGISEEAAAKISVPEPAPAAPPIPVPPMLSAISGQTEIAQAYVDAFNILVGANPCSAFFGGPSAAHVLNELAQQVSLTTTANSIALRMGGEISTVMNGRYNISYRVFDRVEINRNGAFLKAHIFPNDPTVPNVGDFRPNTREARAAILLHELGHMIRRDKGYLLPDDGRDLAISKQNTDRVLSVCEEQIRSVVKQK